MNFGELRFWFLMLTGLAVALAARSAGLKLRPAWGSWLDRAIIATLSLFLLLCVSLETIVIFLTVACCTYFGLWMILRSGSRSRWWLGALIPLQLAPLLYFKYAYFFGHGVLGFQMDGWIGLAIPVGISFYSFQKVSFVVDTLALRKPLPSFLDFINFASFFPQIVAGPIERRESLLPQLEAFRFRLDWGRIEAGMGWLVLGLFFKCVLADNFALFFKRGPADNPFAIWLANGVFGLRIYYDFAGYSFTALGIGKIFGVDLTLNFASPYCSHSPTEFWRRWHITLSQWFRDYVYMPLGGARARWASANVLVVFLVSGVWHGAGWNFVFWGLLHGAALLADRRLKLGNWRWGLGWMATILFMLVTWLFFYETNTSALIRKLATLSDPSLYTPSALRGMLALFQPSEWLALAVFLTLSVGCFALEAVSLRRGEPCVALRRGPLLALMVALIVWLAPGTTNDFIYFAF